MDEVTLAELLCRSEGSIKTGPFGTLLKAQEYAEEGVPIVSVSEVGPGYFRVRRDTPRASAELVARLPEYLLEEGDIVFARKGAVDRSAYVGPTESGWFLGSDGLRVRPGSGVDSQFLAYQLLAPQTRGWLVRHAGGTTMASLSGAVLGRVPLRMPELAVQRSVAAVLRALDDKIASNWRVSAAAGALTAARYQEAVRRATSAGVTFADVCRIGGGGTPNTEVDGYWNGDVPWATPTDITALRAPYISATSRTLTQDGLDACSSPLYPAGSILMTSRATIGAFAVASVPLAVNQGFIVVNPYDPDRAWWVFHEMQSRVDEFIVHANGATFLELSRGKFKALGVRLADEATMKTFNAEATVLHAVAQGLVAESSKLAELRDTLLPQLMSGRLRVRDAEKQVEAVV